MSQKSSLIHDARFVSWALKGDNVRWLGAGTLGRQADQTRQECFSLQNRTGHCNFSTLPDKPPQSRIRSIDMNMRDRISNTSYFSPPERLCQSISIAGTIFGSGDCSVGRYRFDYPGFGFTKANIASDAFMFVIALRAFSGKQEIHGDRPSKRPPRKQGTLSSRDFREVSYVRMTEPFDTVNFFLSRAVINEIRLESGNTEVSNLSCDYGIEDLVMHNLAQAVVPALDRPHEANSLFIDHVLLAAISHIGSRYADRPLRLTVEADSIRRGMLTPRQFREVKERLLAFSSPSPTIHELAILCNLSRSHFIRAFRQTTGLPPHRWLLLEKFAQAKLLLSTTSLSIAVIASECGFSDQAHFARVFSRIAGVSPSHWRRSR